MQEKSVITRTVEAAGGVYAPGHLGELTQIVDFALVDAVIEETGSRERRLRLLPSRVMVYFVLAVRNEVLRVRAGVEGPCRWVVAAA
ncbi:transposase domain-containing protein [Streptomyces sp. NPDC005373]|uniref:transposase domain-containing protein n=1 Tax=Streptomyces sp. NPDC005373 TaxID=3156879 RepID=UPI00339E8A69